MTGAVQAHHALLSILVRLPRQPDLSLEFVVDTGFVGYLTLPSAAVAALNLPFLRRVVTNLADDSTTRVSVHTITIVWQGEERDVQVLAMGRRPLLGMLLRDGCELSVQCRDAGLVTVEPL